LLLTGYLFFGEFGKKNTDVNWQIPWVILSITTSLSLMVSPMLAFFEGLGRVKEVARIRMFQQIVQVSLVLICFSLGFKLFSSPIAAIVSFLIIPVWILVTPKKKLLQFVWSKFGKWQVNYRLEIFPFQWKIALSWISSYFIFQLFNPILFAVEGPVVAGQMGMTLTVLNSIFSLAYSWISTKVPVFSSLIAQGNFEQLDKMFEKTLLQSSVLNALGLIAFFGFIFILRYFDIKINGKNFADCFLPFLPMFFMMIPILLNHIVGSWATYLRCHKKEPLLIQSVVMGCLCCASTLFFGKYYGIIGMTLGYLLLTILGFIWTSFIFQKNRKKWHIKV
jgi:O-antigen/teichoic acid export membrane protein